MLRPSMHERNPRALRPLAILLAGLALAFALGSGRASAAERYHIDVSPLAPEKPGIYLVHSYGGYQGQKTEANGLLVSSGSCVALLDTAWGTAQTRELLDWADSKLHRKVSFAVITHAHADRIGGIAVLRAHGIPTYANERTADAARRGGYPTPDRLFRRAISLHCGDATLDLFYPGPGAHAGQHCRVPARGKDALWRVLSQVGRVDDAGQHRRRRPGGLAGQPRRSRATLPGRGSGDPRSRRPRRRSDLADPRSFG